MHRVASVFIASWVGLSCGGSPTTQPQYADGDNSEPYGDSEDSEGDPLAASDDLSTQAASNSCEGPQCAPCGEGVCIEGFYCDEQAMACSWFPQCAEQPGCDCIDKVLPQCTCEERNGGTYVTCR